MLDKIKDFLDVEKFPDMDALWKTLPLMGKGMLAIFAVAAVIILTVVILNKVTSKKN